MYAIRSGTAHKYIQPNSQDRQHTYAKIMKIRGITKLFITI